MYRPAYLGIGLGALFVPLAVVLPQLVFGLKPAAPLPDPFLSMIETVPSSYPPFQRLAFLMFIIFELTIFGVVSMYSISGIASFGVRVFPLTSWYAVAGWLGAVLLLSLPAMPEDVAVDVKNIWSIFGLVLFFVLPGLLLTIGRLCPVRKEAVA